MAPWGRCDYRQIQALQKRLEKLAEKDFDAFCRAAARELAARLLGKVIRRTPVGETQKHPEKGPDGKRRMVTDHMGGTLRRGWTAKTEAEAQGGGGKTGRNTPGASPSAGRAALIKSRSSTRSTTPAMWSSATGRNRGGMSRPSVSA